MRIAGAAYALCWAAVIAALALNDHVQSFLALLLGLLLGAVVLIAILERGEPDA